MKYLSGNEDRRETGYAMRRAIGRKERRRLLARRRGEIWFGLGTFGLVGWSVAVPVLVLTAFGVWLDRRFPNPISWTLTFLFVGFIVGCLNAWYWLGGERRKIEGESIEVGKKKGSSPPTEGRSA